MRTLGAGTHRWEQVISRSRFITTLVRVDTEAQAREAIVALRHDFADATHNCSAYAVEAGGSLLTGCSDDGEPAGTAGVPMLQVLTSAPVSNVAAVVTRYFGGIKLGAGGLVRAYSSSVSGALADAPLVIRTEQPTFTVSVPLAHAGAVDAALRAANVGVLDTRWGQQAVHHVAFTAGREREVESIISSLIHAPARLLPAEPRMIERPAGSP